MQGLDMLSGCLAASGGLAAKPKDWVTNWPTAALVVPAHAMGLLYLVAALVLGGLFLGFVLRLLRERTLKDARALFWISNNYLALLFAAMVLDRVLR